MGVRRRRAAFGVLPEVPRCGHYALAGGRQSAQSEHAHDRRHFRAAHAHNSEPDRGIDRPRPRRADESRLDRPVARLSRAEGRAVRQGGPDRGNPLREWTDRRRRLRPRRKARRCQRRPLSGGVADRADHPSAQPPHSGGRPGARPSAGPCVQRRVDERGAVLSAPRRADDSRARDSHRHGMGADERVAAAILARRPGGNFWGPRRARHHFGRRIGLDSSWTERTARDAMLARGGGSRDLEPAEALRSMSARSCCATRTFIRGSSTRTSRRILRVRGSF